MDISRYLDIYEVFGKIVPPYSYEHCNIIRCGSSAENHCDGVYINYTYTLLGKKSHSILISQFLTYMAISHSNFFSASAATEGAPGFMYNALFSSDENLMMYLAEKKISENVIDANMFRIFTFGNENTLKNVAKC